MVISKVFGPGPSTSTPAVQLAKVPNEVRELISDGMFYRTSRVLTSVATHHPNLGFVAIYIGYIDGWSADEIHALGECLVPYAQMVAEQVSAKWVMEACHSSMAEDACQEDVILPVEGVEIRSEVGVILLGSELPLSSSTVPSADAVGRP